MMVKQLNPARIIADHVKSSGITSDQLELCYGRHYKQVLGLMCGNLLHDDRYYTEQTESGGTRRLPIKTVCIRIAEAIIDDIKQNQRVSV